MSKVIIGLQIDNRFEEVADVQSILTEYGCIIRTRLGLHQQPETGNNCTEKGLILLELNENCDVKCEELEKELGSIRGIKVRKMVF